MKYDLVVIGGGAAGMMAALQASESGKKVLILEKNKRLGVKLLLTGGGRCNLTNNIPDYRLMAKSYGVNGKFLLSALSNFGVLETMDFFESRGVSLKTEISNKVFPKSNSANDVLSIFIKGIETSGGEIRANAEVADFILSKNIIEKIILKNGEEILANNFLITTGGLSYPATGSSGDGYRWLKDMGHIITPLRPALAPIIFRENFISKLEGLSFDNISITLFLDNKRLAQEVGAIIFTASGISGPAALNLSRFIDFNLGRNFSLSLDFKPEHSKENLDKKLIEIFSDSNKFIKNSLEEVFPPRLVILFLNLLGIDEKLKANSLTRLKRQKILEIIKDFKVNISSILGYDRAMITVGGVDLREIDSKDMRSKIVSNLFLAGEILDIAGPTGGYNLQAAWSTGFTAGKAIV